MAVVGTLTDVGLAALAGRSPRLLFSMEDGAASGANLLASQPYVCIPGPTGDFSAAIASSVGLTTPSGKPATYRLIVEWLDSGGNYTRQDLWSNLFVPYVPNGNVNIGDLIRDASAINHLDVWISETDNPAYFWWFNPATQLLGWN